LTRFKHSKINIFFYLLVMQIISIFILLIYWSIMIFAPVMSEDIKISKAKVNSTKIIEQKILD
jgi:hypothetical protein